MSPLRDHRIFRPATAAERALIGAVAGAFGFAEVAHMAAPSTRRAQAARQTAAAFLVDGLDRAGPRRSFPQAAAVLGVHHTTVLHARRMTAQRLAVTGQGPAPADLARAASAIAVYLGFVPRAEAAAFLARRAAPTAPKEARMPATPSAAEEFGRFHSAALEGLPRAMQREAALLAIERTAAEQPALGERALHGAAARRLGIAREDLALLLAPAAPHRPAVHDEEGDDGLAEPARPEAAGPAGALSRPVVAFAQIHLVASAADCLDMPSTYRRFRHFCRSRGESAVPRAQFGAELLAMARETGGRRDGAMLSGLGLREGARA